MSIENLGHSISGYLYFCQEQLPELDIEYILSNKADWAYKEFLEKCNILAQMWKTEFSPLQKKEYQMSITDPYSNFSLIQIEKLLEALDNCSYSWNQNNNSID
jgi:hypothetical protein